MPIPAILPEELSREGRSPQPLQSPTPMQLMKQAPERSSATIGARALAHCLDSCVVIGFSAYGAKIGSLLLLSAHGAAIASAGKGAGALFQQAYEYSNAQLLSASFAALAVIYFMGLPLVWGRTPGQALLGLRIVTDDGSALTPAKLAYRLGGCALGWASFGVLCLLAFRERDGRLFHDSVSGTRVLHEP